MGKTVPSYRIAIEEEISHWKAFREALPSEAEREAFDAIMDLVRINAMAGSNACRPILFEPMALSILLGQQKKIQQLEKQVKETEQNQAASGKAAAEGLGGGVKLSKVNQLLQGLDTVVLIGRLQQQGLIRLTYNSTVNPEPLIQLTKQGKQLLTDLLLSRQG